MKLCKEFVLKAEEGVAFKIKEGDYQQVIITAVKAETTNSYSTNYVNPPIPEGYKHVCGEWNNGFVIKRDSDGSQFVWIPVGSLDSDGTLDGEHFTEKFGRRNYRNDILSSRGYKENLEGELLEQVESVKKYGGFYISRYNISKGSEGKAQSVKGCRPCMYINFEDAKKVASTIEENEALKSHLTFGAEYDSVLAWLIKSEAKTPYEIVEDSTKWGNYWNTDYSSHTLLVTGSRSEWRTNSIFDLAGNVFEWTQEKYENLHSSFHYDNCHVFRGGNCYSIGFDYPVSTRDYYFSYDCYKAPGFRAVLYIK